MMGQWQKPQHLKGSARHRGSLLPVAAFGAGVAVTVEFIVIGLLPAVATDLEISLSAAGWLVSAFALAAALAGPALAFFGARHDPALMLALLLAGLAGSCLVAAALPVFAIMLAMRFLQGALLTPLIAIGSAAVARQASPGDAAKAVGRLNLGVVLGMLLAVPLGLSLADLLGWQSVFVMLSVLAGLAALLCFQMPSVAPAKDLHKTGGSFRIFKQARVLCHLACSWAVFVAMFASYSFIAAFFQEALDFSPELASLALFVFGLAGVGGNEIVSRCADRAPAAASILTILCVMLATTCLSLGRPDFWPALALAILWGGAHTGAILICYLRVIMTAPNEAAFAGSLAIATANLGIAMGAWFGGWIVMRFGILMIGLGTLAAGSLAVAIALLAVFLDRSFSQNETILAPAMPAGRKR